MTIPSHKLQIKTPRLVEIVTPQIARVANVGSPLLSQTAYWQTRPHDERIAAVISTIGVLTDMRLTLGMLEFIRYLNEQNVQYLVVGGFALGFHGHPRFTKDLDIWVDRTPENAQKLAKAMADFRLPLSQEEIEAFVRGEPIRIGRPPNLIDVIGQPDGVTFEICYAARETTIFEEMKIDFIGRADFIRNKLASGRLQDLADVENLEDL